MIEVPRPEDMTPAERRAFRLVAFMLAEWPEPDVEPMPYEEPPAWHWHHEHEERRQSYRPPYARSTEALPELLPGWEPWGLDEDSTMADNAQHGRS